MNDAIKKRLDEIGLKPIFNVQTPKVTVCPTSDYRLLLEDLDFFATHNPYITLAGLAANQLERNGERLDVRICLVRPDRFNPYTRALDPKIVERCGVSLTSRERCLTWPERIIIADRHESVVVGYMDGLDGEYVTRKVSGFEAFVWQHEIDHLDGIRERLESLTKQNPNDSCQCGSGKKFKKCCGR